MAKLTSRRLSRPGWRFVLRLTIRGAVRNQLFDQAAALTYYAVLSLAPSLVALISLAAIVGDGRKAADALLETVDDVAPDSAIALLKGPLEQFAASPSVGVALVASVLIAIWATSSYVACFGRSLNRIYGVEEGRTIWKVRSLDVIIAVVVMLLAVVTVAALVLSDPVAANLGNSLGIGSTPQTVWSIIKWPVLVIAVTLAVAILYYGTPNAKFPHFRWLSAGALISVIGVLCVSLLFALYVRNFAHFDRTYSSFAGVIVVLIWVWIINLVLLFGADFDAQFERARELETGLPAERQVQLEPRDVTLIERNATRRREEVAEARRIRAAARRKR